MWGVGLMRVKGLECCGMVNEDDRDRFGRLWSLAGKDGEDIQYFKIEVKVWAFVKNERFDTLVGNLVKEILLKLNLPDHKSILTDSKMEVKVTDIHKRTKTKPKPTKPSTRMDRA
ncbi:hypothetical protein Tco_0986490 [Tanacetum coccineum]